MYILYRTICLDDLHHKKKKKKKERYPLGNLSKIAYIIISFFAAYILGDRLAATNGYRG